MSTLVARIAVSLLILLASPAAHSEEQTPPPQAPSPQEKPVDGQPPKPSDGAGSTAAPAQQQGSLLIPRSEKSQPENTEATTAPSKKEKGPYLIKQGDTLWDISHAYLKDPFLWPFIWKANTYIANPDLIYPGNKLIIPDMAPVERAMQSPVEQGRQEEVEKPVEQTASAEADVLRRRTVRTAPTGTGIQDEETAPVRKMILPDETPVPIMDKYSMLNAGFVDEEESKDRITGSREEKTILGFDDIVNISIKSKEDAAIGEKFIIYRTLDKVKHPRTGRYFGRLVKILGILQLTEKGSGSSYLGRITLSFDFAEEGSLLTPYQEPALLYNTGQAKSKELSGYILEVTDTRTINGQVDIVYLDKGSADGVEPGDRFVVYGALTDKTYPKKVIGEAQVFLVKNHTSTAVVRKSSDALAKGDRIESKK
jgi:hypothetical protein